MKSKLIIDDYGIKRWELPNGDLHREDGPAIQRQNTNYCKWFDRYNAWYINGKLHREDGPAVEWSNGSKSWWLYGKEHTDKEYKVFTRSIKINKILGEKS